VVKRNIARRAFRSSYLQDQDYVVKRNIARRAFRSSYLQDQNYVVKRNIARRASGFVENVMKGKSLPRRGYGTNLTFFFKVTIITPFFPFSP